MPEGSMDECLFGLTMEGEQCQADALFQKSHVMQGEVAISDPSLCSVLAGLRPC